MSNVGGRNQSTNTTAAISPPFTSSATHPIDAIKPKRAKPFSATLHSTKALEADGWTVTKVEQRIPGCFITRDAYGFGDLLICSPSRGIALVQVTGGTGKSNFNARVAKINAEARAGIWMASGGRIIVHSWEKIKGSKERNFRILEITK